MKRLLCNFSHAWGKYGLAIAFAGISLSAYPQFDKYWKIEGNLTQDSIHNVVPKIGTLQNSPVLFITNGSEKFRLTETGKIGIGTTNPTNLLEVIGGSIFTSNPIICTVQNGQPPFIVASNTMVTNLNTDLLDGEHKSYYATANHAHKTLLAGCGLNGTAYNGADSTTLNVKFGGNGVNCIASRSDHTHAQMITGMGNSNQISYWNGTSSLTSDGSYTWENNNKLMKISSVDMPCSILLEQKINNPVGIDVPSILYKWNIINNNGSFTIKLNNDSRFFINPLGNIGISNTSPTCKLDVNGAIKASSIKLTSNAQNGYILISDASGNAIWKNPMLVSIGDWDKSNNNLYRQTGNVGIGNNNPLAKLSITSSNITGLSLNCSNVNYGYAIQTKVNNPLIKAFALSLDNSEKLLIWGDGKMEVDNIIKAKEIEVKTNVFADYVFYDNYRPMPLEELHQYILSNKHLPEVPTQEEAIKNGINIGEMNVLLLKKIEELTLYVIELKQENSYLYSEINEVKKTR
jgi:hypothetical protein